MTVYYGEVFWELLKFACPAALHNLQRREHPRYSDFIELKYLYGSFSATIRALRRSLGNQIATVLARDHNNCLAQTLFFKFDSLHS